MYYQISYYSPQGHAKDLAFSFRRIFPSRTPVVDMAKDIRCDGNLHLIGFEFFEPKLEIIPDIIHNFLSTLENKEVLLFATCPICVTEQQQIKLERNLISALPKTCKYHGLFLCQGEVYKTKVNALTEQILQKQDNKELKELLRQYRKGKGHPNREDIRKGYRYIAAEFQLDTYL